LASEDLAVTWRLSDASPLFALLMVIAVAVLICAGVVALLG